jgi:heme/copper-type cytochrome/quinol oxidase subunit 1
MRFGAGLAILPFALALLVALARRGPPEARERPLHAALVASLALFGVGGVIGAMIHGSNVKIPAHYHGSIVGVTLAFMGLTYHLLPRLGFGAASLRAASWQPWIYGGGQLLHVIGLVWSGGYGVQRKVAGAAQALRSTEEVLAMGLMGLGGLVAVAGGLTFLVLVLGAMARRPGAREPALAVGRG